MGWGGIARACRKTFEHNVQGAGHAAWSAVTKWRHSASARATGQPAVLALQRDRPGCQALTRDRVPRPSGFLALRSVRGAVACRQWLRIQGDGAWKGAVRNRAKRTVLPLFEAQRLGVDGAMA